MNNDELGTLTIIDIGRKTATLAQEILDLNERLLRLNHMIFGKHRSPDIPKDPPSQKSAEVAPISETNLIDSFNYETSRAFYYMTYAREMVGQLESFIGAPTDHLAQKGVSQQAGGTFRDAKSTNR